MGLFVTVSFVDVWISVIVEYSDLESCGMLNILQSYVKENAHERVNSAGTLL